MSDLQTHIVQFRLHFYKGDSIIKTKLDLNRNHTVYSVEENKCHKYEFCFDESKKKEPFLKEMGNYDKEDGDCEEYYYYFYTPTDVFFVEYLHEIGNFDYDDDSTTIKKWLDDSFNEDSMYDFFSALPQIYKDVKLDIDKYLEERTHLCNFIFERLLIIKTYSYTTGYEYVEYECNFFYNGVYNLVKPKEMTEDEEFELMNGMSKAKFDEMIDKQYSDMAEFLEKDETE